MKVLPLRVVLVLLALMSSVVLIAQNPISIQRLGTTASGVAVTTTLPVTVASLPLPSGASTSALQSTINTTLGSPFQAGGSIGNTTFTVTQGTGTNLHIVCDSGCSSSTAPADEAAFTAGTTPFGIAGGFFQTTATNNALTNGQMGAWQFTANRAGFVNLRTAAGVETGVAAAPLQVSLANTGSNSTAVTVSQATASSLNATIVGTGTLATQSAITAASGSIASGAVSSGAYASGAIASGAIASGAVASGAYGSDSGSFGVGATGAAPPAKASYSAGIASGATGGFLTGITVCDSSKGINVTTATTTLMVTGVSGRQVRVCALKLVTAAANNVQFISGTGATCGTGTTGIGGGGTSAASGDNYAANGGSAYGSGIGQLFTTTATGDSLCLVTSAGTQLSGIITYTIY